MRAYYAYIFPYDWIESFLTCEGTYKLSRRDFAFRYPDYIKKNESFKEEKKTIDYMILFEYDSNDLPCARLPLRFGSTHMLRKFLIATAPAAIDVGPIFRSVNYAEIDRKDNYAHRPNFLPFDVDIKDYFDKKNRPTDKNECGAEGHALCDSCWFTYGRPALIDLVKFLKEFMKFDKVIPIFSGGGGFHVHVLDERVWEWDQETRDDLNRFVAKYVPTVILDLQIRVNHLIKLPFSPHKNGNLSLPILDIKTFLPSRDAVKMVDMTKEMMIRYVSPDTYWGCSK